MLTPQVCRWKGSEQQQAMASTFSGPKVNEAAAPPELQQGKIKISNSRQE
jgi:hypothetical protein